MLQRGFSSNSFRFGVFEVNVAGSELRKQGLRIRLQEQPFQVLTALLERPGEVVTREDLIRRLWPDGTIVNYDRSLNSAVTRLRQALSDSADVPRYVETVARRGYRFIGSLDRGHEPAPAPRVRPASRLRNWTAAIAVCIFAAAALWWSAPAHTSRADTPLHVVPLTIGSGVERDASFSPDGNQIVYEWLRDDNQRHIYLDEVGQGDPVPLTSGTAAEFGPAWSPDGRLIAFLRQLGESKMGVFVIAPIGGAERKVAETAPPPYWVLQRFHRRLDWTHDSRHIIVSVPDHPGGGEGLLLVAIDDGRRTWLTKPSADSLHGDREPAVSPDGSMVAFARGEAAANEMIHLLPLSADLRPAGAARALESAGPARSPAWAPDGKRIVYTTLNPGMTFSSGVWEIGLNRGDAPRQLVALGRNAAVASVARTWRLAYSQILMRGTVWRQEIPTRGEPIPPPVKVTSGSAMEFNGQYSPDGRRIAIASNRSGPREIWTCAQDGDHCLQITRFNGAFISGSPRWSPDGKQLVFDSGANGSSAIYVAPAEGGTPRRLTDDTTHGYIPSWSHDGRWIYFSSAATGRNEIWRIPSAGGKASPVTREGGLVAFDSPDAKTLYYTKTEDNSTLFRSTAEGNDETAVLSGVAKRGFVVSHDRIYYVREEPGGSFRLRCFMLRTRLDSPVAPMHGSVFLGLGLSPDGKDLVYSEARAQSNLMLVEDFR